MRLYQALLTLITGSFSLCAGINQDSVDSGFNMNIQSAYYWLNEGMDAKAKIPNLTSNESGVQSVGKPVNGNSREIPSSDNPLRHIPAYIDFKFKYLNSGFNLSADIIAEHRGISYGVYNSNAMKCYPKILLGFDSSFAVLNRKIDFGVYIGNRENLKLQEGLNIYNLDCQGVSFYFKYNKIKYEFFDIGDLMNQIGLNIDGAHNQILSIEDINVYDKYKAGVSIAYFNYDVCEGYSMSARLGSENEMIYSQLAMLKKSEMGAKAENSAFMLGGAFNKANSNYNLNIKGEYRFFGKAFNCGRYDATVTYRKKRDKGDLDDCNYNNTIGENIYPVNYYEREFSQWAVYTEYQGRNVNAISLVINGKLRLIDDLFLKSDIDINYIKASSLDSYIYKFITAGVAWEANKNRSLYIGASNKSMNLDKHYPTFFELAKLYLLVNFQIGFDAVGK